MIRISVTFLVLLLLLVTPNAQAQDSTSEEVWYWAWKAETGEILSYNANGTIHILDSGVTFALLKPLNSQVALALLETGDEYALYKLEEQAITQLSQRFVGNLKRDSGLWGFSIIGQHLPQILMASDGKNTDVVWIINIENNSIEVLDRHLKKSYSCVTSLLDKCVRFSLDGSVLRYMAAPTKEDGVEISELRERILATGEEKVIFTINSDPKASYYDVSCEPDLHGDHWLCNTYAELPHDFINDFWLLSVDGSVQPLFPPDQIHSMLWRIYFSQNDVVMTIDPCEDTCTVTLKNVVSGKVLRIPTDGDLSIWKLIRVDEEHMLVFMNSRPQVGILAQDGSLERLGNTFCCEMVKTESDDGHWVVVWEPDNEVSQIWDVKQQRLLFEIPFSVTSVDYVQNGFIISDRLTDRFWAYFYTDNTNMELARSDRGLYFDILPDKNLLYEYVHENGEMPVGIYRYDLIQARYTLLIPGGCSLCYDWLS